MTSIPHVADAMRAVLHEGANTHARTYGVIQRERAMTGSQLVQTLVFGWLENPDATMAELTTMAKTLGVTISAPGLCQRFTDPLVACMAQVVQDAIGTVVAADPLATPLLARFSEVLLQDSTTISLPAIVSEHFAGCGGRDGEGMAAIKAQVRLDVRSGRLEGPIFQDGRASDRAVAFARRPLDGSLTIRDLGYFHLDDMARDTRDGRWWLSRLKPQTAVFRDGIRVNLLDVLRQEGSDTQTTMDLAVTIGVDHRTPCRLLIIRVPEQTAALRRQRLHRTMRKKGKTASADLEAWCGWTVVVTNVPEEVLTLTEAVVLMRVRWHIELLFKLWKSHGKVDESRGQGAARVLIELYAKLIGMIIQHWILLTGCWQDDDRSLPKAANIVRAFTTRLAKAMRLPRALSAVLRILMKELAQADKQTPRTKEPNTYQLVRDPNLLGWSLT